ncbi:MAG TPA: heparan-alpha-glucosaminide N-acetyltransferase domain-containing protein [Pyrinomonadaceae bacterium]|jgi:predicted acyltransferase|nr:heparan-alpha-glucosaminide N-acetyltransferase domain-containing protein [Pyrinomonadaceae bacterium]
MGASVVEYEVETAAGAGGLREAPPSTRLLSLDAFRGLTVAGMILVNNPGTWGAIYSPLAHAEWHGWTPTDLVFPFFLFIVGVSITLALSRRAAEDGRLYGKILRRALLIFALGIFLNGFPYFPLDTLRIPGVLQRIAVCYLFAALVFVKTSWRTQGLITAALLLFYWALVSLVPAPGYAAGDLTMAGSLPSYVDRVVFGAHKWKPLYDPEGLLSTIPAVATTLCGVLTGHLLRSRRGHYEKVSAMFVAGAGGVVLGWAWNYWFPINKALWTSSYVLFAAGMALQTLALCYWLIDIRNFRRWALPFVVFGTNALAAFFLSGVVARLLGLIKLVGPDGKDVSLQGVVYKNLFASWAAPKNASLAYAVCFVLVMLGLMAILYRKRIFIKV